MKRYLSIDGGGIRAYLPLQVLRYIEQQSGKPCNQLFNVLAGTSTGAICAIALANGVSAVQVEQFYNAWGPRIFSRRWASKLSFGLAGPKYDAAALEEGLKRVLGADTPLPEKAFVCTTRMDVLLPRTFWGGTPGDREWKAWEVARASSAAPTYFNAYVRGSVAYWDGGCVGGNNNPSNTALEMLGCSPKEALMLSLGTGVGNAGWPAKKVLGWGTLECVPPLLAGLMDAGSEQTHLDLAHVMPAEQYLRIQARLANTEMDDCSPANVATLRAAGQALVDKNRAALDSFISRLLAA